MSSVSCERILNLLKQISVVSPHFLFRHKRVMQSLLLKVSFVQAQFPYVRLKVRLLSDSCVCKQLILASFSLSFQLPV